MAHGELGTEGHDFIAATGTIGPRVSLLTTILALGEGWHDYHHMFPWDYAAAELDAWDQWNPTKAFIDTCALVGLVTGRRRCSVRLQTATRQLMLGNSKVDSYVVEGPPFLRNRKPVLLGNSKLAAVSSKPATRESMEPLSEKDVDFGLDELAEAPPLRPLSTITRRSASGIPAHDVPEADASLPDPNIRLITWLGPISPETDVLQVGMCAMKDSLQADTERKQHCGIKALDLQHVAIRHLLSGDFCQHDFDDSEINAALKDIETLDIEHLLSIRSRHLNPPNGKAISELMSTIDKRIITSIVAHLFRDNSHSLGCEGCAMLVRHVFLACGANQMIKDNPIKAGNDCWLLDIDGFRGFLHVPTMKISSTPPEGAVCCYRNRSHTDMESKDPRHWCTFCWQIFLVEDPQEWKEDSLSAEERTWREAGISDRLCLGRAAIPSQASTAPASPTPAPRGADVAEVFDSLQSSESSDAGTREILSPRQEDDNDDNENETCALKGSIQAL